MLKKLTQTPDDKVFTLLRLVLGVIFFAHGSQKMLGWFGGYGFKGTMAFFTQTAHIPAVFALAHQSPFWHDFQRVSFLLAGLLFWRPVIGSSGWTAPVYLFLATLPCDALSAFFVFCGRVVYRPYLSALDDQELAGAVMWVAVTFFYLIPALVLAARQLSGERGQAAEIEVA